ncbi:hypothetical protein EON68_00505 [archaeon]|nr:MAG: hypothetical protein EON68_00505 [archaeon]
MMSPPHGAGAFFAPAHDGSSGGAPAGYYPYAAMPTGAILAQPTTPTGAMMHLAPPGAHAAYYAIAAPSMASQLSAGMDASTMSSGQWAPMQYSTADDGSNSSGGGGGATSVQAGGSSASTVAAAPMYWPVQ